MWGIAWVNIQMMLADAPKYVTTPEKKELTSAEEARKFLKL